MKPLSIDNIFKIERFESELDVERASVLRRKLRLMAKDDPKYISANKRLKELITEYEARVWNPDKKISDQQIAISDLSAEIAEAERKFYQKRKQIIREKLKEYGLKQEDLGKLLGHSKSYMSELINGIKPLSKTDISLIKNLLKIDIADLFPAVVDVETRLKVKKSIEELNNPILNSRKDELLRV
jgi:transcriptional regulator with XRE-family HTH domain